MVFAPGQDELNNANGYYCKITYVVKDSEGALSLTSKTITISITPVDQPPRPENNQITKTVRVLEDSSIDVPITGYDPEGADFYMVVLDCDENKGSYQLVTSVNIQPVQCNDYEIPISKSQAGGAWTLRFTPNQHEFGFAYNVMHYTFVQQLGGDYSQTSVLNINTLQVDVLERNYPPAITAFGVTGVQVQPTQHVQVDSTQLLPLASIEDINLYQEDVQGTVTVTVSLTDAKNANAKLSLTPDPSVSIISSSSTRWIFSGAQVAVNATLRTLAIKFTKEGSFNFTIFSDDGGNFGACVAASGEVISSCALQDSVVIPIEVTPKSSSISTIALGGAGGAAAIIAGIAGGIAWKKMAKPKHGYEPWAESLIPENGALTNPLYIGSESSGSNPLYEGRRD